MKLVNVDLESVFLINSQGILHPVQYSDIRIRNFLKAGFKTLDSTGPQLPCHGRVFGVRWHYRGWRYSPDYLLHLHHRLPLPFLLHLQGHRIRQPRGFRHR